MKLGKAKKLVLPLMGLTILLSGCGQVNNHAPGFYKYLAIPTTSVLNFFAHIGGYGMAVVILTVIIRLILIPISLRQARGTTIHRFKLRPIKKEVAELRHKRINEPTLRARNHAAQQIHQLYKKYHISSTGGIGCSAIIIQILILMSLASSIKASDALFHARFLGVNLGSHTIWLPVVIFLFYLLQVYISSGGHKFKGLWAMVISPTIIFFVCLGAPLGISIYFLVSSIFACLQAYLSQSYRKILVRKIHAGEIDLGPMPEPEDTGTANDAGTK